MTVRRKWWYRLWIEIHLSWSYCPIILVFLCACFFLFSITPVKILTTFFYCFHKSGRQTCLYPLGQSSTGDNSFVGWKIKCTLLFIVNTYFCIHMLNLLCYSLEPCHFHNFSFTLNLSLIYHYNPFCSFLLWMQLPAWKRNSIFIFWFCSSKEH